MRLHQGLRGGGSEFTYIGSSSTASGATVNTPSGTKIGDILVLADVARNESGTAPSYVLPTGFTLLKSTSKTLSSIFSQRNVTSIGLAKSNGVYAITGMNAGSEGKALLCIRRRTAVSGFTPGTFNGETTGDSDTNPGDRSYGASTVTLGGLVVISAGYCNASTSDASVKLYSASAAVLLHCWYVTTASDKNTKTISACSDGGWHAGYVRIT